MSWLKTLIASLRWKISKPFDGKTWNFRKGCPDCGSTRFYEGPSGGMCINIECVDCGSKFNVGPFQHAERII